MAFFFFAIKPQKSQAIEAQDASANRVIHRTKHMDRDETSVRVCKPLHKPAAGHSPYPGQRGGLLGKCDPGIPFIPDPEVQLSVWGM